MCLVQELSDQIPSAVLCLLAGHSAVPTEFGHMPPSLPHAAHAASYLTSHASVAGHHLGDCSSLPGCVPAQAARKQPPRPKHEAPNCTSAERLRVMVWNCGGLAYQDFMQWLSKKSQHVDIIVILETRLAHNMVHTTEAYFVIHSAKPQAGVMILIHKILSPAERITCQPWREAE